MGRGPMTPLERAVEDVTLTERGERRCRLELLVTGDLRLRAEYFFEGHWRTERETKLPGEFRTPMLEALRRWESL